MAVPIVDREYLGRLSLATLIAVTVSGVAVALAVFRRFVLLVLIGLVVTELVQAIAEPLQRRFKGPHGLWLAVAVLLLLGVTGGVVALCTYPLLEQLSGLLADVPKLLQSLAERGDQASRWFSSGHVHPEGKAPPIELGREIGRRAADVAMSGGRFVVTLLEGLFQALAVVILGIFVAATPRTHRLAFLHLLPEPLRPRGRAFLAAARAGLRNWMVAVTVSMGIMGAIVTGGLWFIGVPYFLVFGVFAGFMELVPYIGPVLAFALPTLLCLATDPKKAISCALFYLVVHALEANVIVPLVVRSRAHVPPSLVVLAILVLGALAGVVGLIAATPALTIALAAVQEFWLEPRTTGGVGELPDPAVSEAEEPRREAA